MEMLGWSHAMIAVNDHVLAKFPHRHARGQQLAPIVRPLRGEQLEGGRRHHARGDAHDVVRLLPRLEVPPEGVQVG